MLIVIVIFDLNVQQNDVTQRMVYKIFICVLAHWNLKKHQTFKTLSRSLGFSALLLCSITQFIYSQN